MVHVLDKEGKPASDAVVVVVPASKTGNPKTPLPSQVTIYQEKMRFVPAVSLVALGAKAQFVNNDPWEHHVRASAAGVAHNLMRRRPTVLSCGWTASLKANRPKLRRPYSTRPARCFWAATSTAPCAGMFMSASRPGPC
ncbi:hypothetical protein LP416_05620 [Polaromonas sp. P2-4]|nr:hypothetical protein LP416_05620 [Polaromonas sp. P2-4]